MTARVLVAGIGNIFRTDDGFGSELARRLAEPPGLPEGVRVVDYGIRGMHLAYDLLDGPDLLVLLDALPGSGAPGEVVLLRIGPDDVPAGAAVDAHAMDPATVLAALHSLGGRLPARTFLVGCRAGDVGEGMGLTPPVAAALEAAAGEVRALLVRELDRAEVG